MKLRFKPLIFLIINVSILISVDFSLAQDMAIEARADSQQIIFKIDYPQIVLANVPFDIAITATDSSKTVIESFNEIIAISGTIFQAGADSLKKVSEVHFSAGKAKLENLVIPYSGHHPLKLMTRGTNHQINLRVIPGILSLAPPIIAIILAFVARQVLVSLFCGVWIGSIFIYDYNIINGFIRTVDTFFIKAITDSSQAAILLFSLTLGGMVGVISRSGGTAGIVDKLSEMAKTRRAGQLVTWAMGLLIFFDDYANTLVVGNTMRPFTDKLKISREKLSYIVDSTAAPVASIAIISTWVGFQVGLIEQVFSVLHLDQNAYGVFLKSIPFSTYSILALFFVFMIAASRRDFGPMRQAEIRAVNEGKPLRDGAQPVSDTESNEFVPAPEIKKRWYNGLIPIVVVILITFAGLYMDGKNELGADVANSTLGQIFGAANSYNVLIWAAFSGMFVAAFLSVMQRILKVGQAISAAVSGYKSMLLACMVLILAWSIGDICETLNTAGFVLSLTQDMLSPHMVPFITFFIAGIISFSTGSSWATMAILTPIVIPIAHSLSIDAGLEVGLSFNILLATIGAILSGSVFGDHCSPISDTTILSSMASAADHVDHVRTQLPYAMTAGFFASVCGYIPAGWGLPPYISIVIGMTGMILFLRVFGKTQEETSSRISV